VTKINTDITGTRFKTYAGGDPTQAMDYHQFALPLNVIPEFANIRYVKITFTKAFGGKNIGNVGVFGPEGGGPTANTNNNFAFGQPSPDTLGWTDMGAIITGASAGVHEQTVTNNAYVAQRFQTTASGGSFLFMFNGRLPSTVFASSGGQQNLVLFSIWDDSTQSSHPAPGKPLVGSNDVQRGFNFVTGNAFTSIGAFTFDYVNSNVVQGWTQVPFPLISAVGPNSAQDNAHLDNPMCVEIGVQTPVPPGTFLWLVMRVNSAGQNFFPEYTDLGGLNNTPFMGAVSPDAGGTWNSLGGGAFNQYSLSSNPHATFRSWSNAPLNSAGRWAPNLTTTQVHMPGTVGITSAATGQANQIIPITTDRNGARFDVTNAVSVQPGGDSTEIWTVEPVTKDHFVAVSMPAQEGQIAQISFPTSIIAQRDAYGDCFVAFPCSANGGFRRIDATISVDYVAF
jgi:hypothetical protein